MSEASKHEPYLTLGKHLRYLREQHKESVAEVSGAVEIDSTDLERIEAGVERPAEDILMLLISHFNMQDQEAVQLWELAGYTNEAAAKTEEVLQDIAGQKPMVILFGIDARVMYSDSFNVAVNEAGAVLNFGHLNEHKQHVPVAKLGMSIEQTQAVIAELQRSLLRAKYLSGPKALPEVIDPHHPN